jgi:hypothetical protein
VTRVEDGSNLQKDEPAERSHQSEEFLVEDFPQNKVKDLYESINPRIRGLIALNILTVLFGR